MFRVANPSPYERSDYVEVDMELLGVPIHLNEKSLKLSRLASPDLTQEIPYQIDSLFGRSAPKRVLTFLSTNTPPGPSDYSQPSADFLLEEASPKNFHSIDPQPLLSIEHYYTPQDHENTWNSTRRVIGVLLRNGAMEVYFSFVPRPWIESTVNYTGAATSIFHHAQYTNTISGEFLSPHWGPYKEQSHWGQLTHLDFYTLPWEPQGYYVESLLQKQDKEREYTLVWSNSGPLRVVVTLKSEPIFLRYSGEPFFQTPNEVVLKCHLYRIISLYPDNEYYTERLTVRPEDYPDVSLAFRPYYSAYTDFYEAVQTDLVKHESIPDYFVVWKRFAQLSWGYGFAADSYIRALDLKGSKVQWHLDVGHNHKCIHYFMFKGYPNFDRLDTIGHTGWYEQIYKPLEAVPLMVPPRPDPSSQVTRDQVFISYSHKDQRWLEDLQTMLAPIVRNEIISVWWDGKTNAGQKWREEIDKALASARVGVLLVSQHFLASEFIKDLELPYLINAVDKNSVKLLWILVGPCLYQYTEIQKYQAAHDVSKPLNSLKKPQRDAVLVKICEQIAEAINPTQVHRL
jgi:hypothetical protein